ETRAFRGRSNRRLCRRPGDRLHRRKSRAPRGFRVSASTDLRGGDYTRRVMSDPLVLGGRSFESRLIVGTGKYKDVSETERAIDASGAEVVTVALRRVDLGDRSSGSLMALLTRKSWVILPNTAGCFTAAEAVRTLRLARELGIAQMVKLEVIGDKNT